MSTQPTNPAAAPSIYDEAMVVQTPKSLIKTYFGEITIVDIAEYILAKGQPKRLFDASIDDPNKKSIEVTLQVECENSTGGTYALDQTDMTFSKVWQVTLRSINAVGLHLRNLKGQFVQVQRVGSGDWYTSKTTGERREKQALKFVQVYPTRDDMRAAADAFYTPKNQPTSVDDKMKQAYANAAAAANTVSAYSPVPTAAPAAPAAPSLPAVNREQMALFLAPLWQMSQGNVDAFHAAIAGNAMLAPLFNKDSIEVCAFTGNTPF